MTMLSDDSLAKALYDEFGMNLNAHNPERYWAAAADGIRRNWLAQHDAAVRADMQPREVRTVEWEYGWLADESIRQTLTPRGPRLMLDDWVDTPENIARFPKGQRVRRTKAGPWLPVTPSTPNQQGAEHA